MIDRLGIHVQSLPRHLSTLLKPQLAGWDNRWPPLQGSLLPWWLR